MQLPENILNTLTNKKVIFGIVGVVLLGEIVWAGSTLSKKQLTIPTPLAPAPTAVKQRATISLNSDKPQVKVGEKFTVNISLSSSKSTDGSDVILNYDPTSLTVSLASAGGIPVEVTDLYNDYPSNLIDTKSGRVALSGISTKNEGTIPNGVIGKVTFTAKKIGPAKVSVEFTKGSTADSNITETKTGQDVLDGVSNLELTVTP